MSRRIELAALIAWVAFAAWLASGFPPVVDLPAHAAEIETVKRLWLGDALVRSVYGVHFVPGYGLVTWLALPLALVWNGAVAARIFWGLSIALYPVSIAALADAWRRPRWVALLGLPLVFNLSYVYGYLPGYFSQPLLWFTVAAFVKTLETPSLRRIVAVNLLAAAVFQAHLLTFAVLGVIAAAITVAVMLQPPALTESGPPAIRSPLRTAVASLALPTLLSVSRIWVMARRAVQPGDWPKTEWDLASHFNWFFKNQVPDGAMTVWAPLIVVAVFLVIWARRIRLEPPAPAWAFFALLLVYCVTPKTLSGVFLVSVRLPALIGVLALMLIDPRELSRVGLGTLGIACGVALAQVVGLHLRFERETEGLGPLIRRTTPTVAGYFSTVGPRFDGSRHLYLEHMGQWLTGARGGVGHDFFAGTEHQPVFFQPGQALPLHLEEATADQLRRFQQVLVFGEGPLPPLLRPWRQADRSGPWRLLVPSSP